MSGIGLIGLGLKAMTASSTALQVTGHNISNANVQGYSRQEAELATSMGQFTGAGYFGKGVDVVTIKRSHNEFLTRQADASQSLAAMDAARNTQLKRLENLFPTGEQGLGATAGAFLNSMADLANRPSDASSRQVVLARAGDLASRFKATGDGLDDMQAGVTADVTSAVAEVNGLAADIARVNQRIAELKGLGQPANDLLDQRERLVSQVAEHLSVTRLEASDGTMSVFVAGGQSLVLGTTASTLTATPDPSDTSRISVALKEGALTRTLDSRALSGGDIAGFLNFQNQDLTDARNMVGQMGASLAEAVNKQQALGLTLQSPLGSVAGSPLFAYGAPRTLAHASNGAPPADVTLTVVDGSALKASDYDLSPDTANPGNYTLVRRSDGLTRSIGSGDVVDGLRIDVGPTGMQPGDRFLLQPVGRSANSFALMLSDPRDVAAASPLISLASPANVGTARAATLSVTASPLPTPGATARLTFTDDAGNYVWELYDSSNTLLANGSGAWQAGAAVPTPPTDINGFSMTLDGVPRTGDVITVEPTPASALSTNNGNALALLALRDQPLVDGQTATDAYAHALADVGVRVQSSTTAADISQATASQAESARSSQAGVNLDEEAAKLIQFQQSYQAAGKMLQVAQSLFDTVLQLASAR